jgi:predicted enzyme related to lactoylglutathione lyase
MPAIATFALTAVDCPDPLALARFYSDVTGWAITADSDSSWAKLASPSGATIAFQGVDDHRPPDWPGSEHPQQLHLDFDVPDLDAGERAVLAIGATKADYQPGGESFRVFLDPAGHPFCLCRG